MTESFIGTQEVTLQLDCVLQSPDFAKAARSQRLLRYLVEAALAQPPSIVKEYTLAIDVFDRNPDYDPTVDATVRVEAGRLRNRLRQYYLEQGRHDTLVIDVPKGAYSAVFSRRVPSKPAFSFDLSAPQHVAESSPSPPPTGAPVAKHKSSLPFRRVVCWLASLLCLAIGATFWARVHAASAHAGQLRTGPVIHSLAVLPLKNLSGDSEQDYFAYGTTDELITELARIPNLRVVSWSSVLQEKDTKKPLRTIAEELRADAVVEGSVYRSGESVRVNAQLIDTRTDTHLWAGSFEGRASEMMALEDTAAREIAAHTRSAVASNNWPAKGSRVVRSIDPAAHDAYLRGLYYYDSRDALKSTAYFQQAVELDPVYSSAYAGLALALDSEGLMLDVPTQDVIPRATAAASKAIELDPGNGEAYIALGIVQQTFGWDWNAAKRDLQHGLELSPNNSAGLMMYAIHLDTMGDPEGAIAYGRRARDDAPFRSSQPACTAAFFSMVVTTTKRCNSSNI